MIFDLGRSRSWAKIFFFPFFFLFLWSLFNLLAGSGGASPAGAGELRVRVSVGCEPLCPWGWVGRWWSPERGCPRLKAELDPVTPPPHSMEICVNSLLHGI